MAGIPEFYNQYLDTPEKIVEVERVCRDQCMKWIDQALMDRGIAYHYDNFFGINTRIENGIITPAKRVDYASEV